MVWEEVLVAREENRRELVLSGKVISPRVTETSTAVLDPNIFTLVNLNFLDLSSTPQITKLPDEVGNLVNLTSLVMSHNAIEKLPAGNIFAKLNKLKVVDFSSNKIQSIPHELASIGSLTTLNLSLNQLEDLPSFEKAVNLSHLDVSSNQLSDISCICHKALVHLSDVAASKNEIGTIPADISQLAALKKLDLSDNKIKVVPGNLADCTRLKELDLKGNALSDNRLKKMVAQKGPKAVLEYIRQNCPKVGDEGGKGSKEGKKGKGKKGKKHQEEEEELLCDKLEVLHMFNESPQIVVETNLVKDTRPYIIACIVRNVDLSDPSVFKGFIQLQTRLHDTVCDKRNVATIATHDLGKLPPGSVVYTAKPPQELKIIPLMKDKEFCGETLVNHLRDEAEAYRKEKKRATVSGVHQYLNMLQKKELYACLIDASGRTISFPPITNADGTKISTETKDIFVEVTSETKLSDAKTVADVLLKQMLDMGIGANPEASSSRTLNVEQVKIVDEDGNLKVVYPSKTDLVFSDKRIAVKRP